jgi:hypothetical protein
MSKFIDYRDPILVQTEERIRSELTRVDGSPFLGHLELPEPEAIRQHIRAVVDGIPSRVLSLYGTFPGVGVWTLARMLSDDYGADGSNEIYPRIEALFGVDELSRPDLSRKFRSACQKLKLPLPEIDTRYLVYEYNRNDDYFLQAGAPQEQLVTLAEVFSKAEARLGPPPLESSSALVDWERAAVEQFMPVHLRRLPKALLFDPSGYHAALYAALRDSRGFANSFATRFADAIQKAQARAPTPKDQADPTLQCIDGQLCIADRRGRFGFRVRVGDREHVIQPRRRFILAPPWPRKLQVAAGPGGEQEASKTLNVFSSPTVMLVFDADRGRLIKEIDVSVARPVGVPYGSLVLASQSAFDLDGKPSYDLAPDAHVLYPDIKGRRELRIEDYKVELVPSSQWVLHGVNQTRIASLQGHPWWVGLEAIEASYQDEEAREWTGTEDGRYTLRFSHSGDPAWEAFVPLLASGAGVWRADVASVLPRAGAFGLLTMELRQEGSDRRIMAESFWHWPGLRAFVDGEWFDADAIPPNWDEDLSEAFSPSEAGQLRIADPSETPFIEGRLVFSDPRTSKPLAFEFTPPGLSVLLIDTHNSAQPLRVGQTLALSHTDGGLVEIRCASGEGQLEICGELIDQPFDRFNRWRKTTTGLIDALGDVSVPGHKHAIRYRKNPSQPWGDVLILTDVAVPATFFLDELDTGEQRIDVSFPRAFTDIRLCVRGLFHGQTYTSGIGDGIIEVQPLHGNTAALIQFRPLRVPSKDIWLCELEVTFGGGRWRRLINPRQDRYIWATNNGIANDLLLDVKHEKSISFFHSISDTLGICVSEKCWPTIERHVLSRWKNLGMALLSSAEDRGRRLLLEASTQMWPLESSSTWVPIHHPLEIDPGLLTADISAFAQCTPGHRSPLSTIDGASHLAILADLPRNADAFGAIEATGVDRRVAGAFRNAARAQKERATPLEGFSFSRYLAAIGSIPADEEEVFWTPRRDRLTVAHHSWCCQQLASRLAKIDLPGHNGYRLRDLNELILAASAVRSPLEAPLPPERSVGVPPVLLEQTPILESLPHLVNLWCWASRMERMPWLRRALAQRSASSSVSTLQTMGLLMRLGPELFGFYLLLWHIARCGGTTSDD